MPTTLAILRKKGRRTGGGEAWRRLVEVEDDAAVIGPAYSALGRLRALVARCQISLLRVKPTTSMEGKYP
jgi:hypothetical protein